jgi:hypothetical protein
MAIGTAHVVRSKVSAAKGLFAQAPNGIPLQPTQHPVLLLRPLAMHGAEAREACGALAAARRRKRSISIRASECA